MSEKTMQVADAVLSSLMRDRAGAILADWQTRLEAVGGSYCNDLVPPAEQEAEMSALLDALHAAVADPDRRFENDTGHPLARSLTAASQVRAARGFSTEESLQFVLCCKDALIGALQGDADLREAAPGAIRRVGRLFDRCILILAASFVAGREDIIRRQTASLREVSTPVIALWDGILLLPLVGIVDSVRAQQISERLLRAIGEREAAVTLIDVTGVPVMDTSVARHILKTVAAAEMLGTRVILTGISPNTAQTMVKLGIDMSGVPTRGSLKSGVALALRMTGRTVSEAAQD